MADEHERYARLAVGHVLGGLAAADSAAFRSHVLTCRGCRARVAELRGIAADLAAAEREERARVALRTEVADDARVSTAEAPATRIKVRHVTIAVVVVLVFSLLTAFWNLHLRTMADGYAAALDAQEEVLAGLVDGVPIDAELAEGVSGLVTTDGTRVWASLTGVPELERNERLVAWLISDDASDAGVDARAPDSSGEPEGSGDSPDTDGSTASPQGRVIATPQSISDGGVVMSLATEGAHELVVSREHVTGALEPSEDVVLSARIRSAG